MTQIRITQIPKSEVFVSSTTKDLWQYRKKAVEVIKELSEEYKGRFQLVEKTMDTEGQSGERKTPITKSTDMVQASDWIVLIVAWNYGHVQEDENNKEKWSVTEWEYRFSQKMCDSPKCCFVYLAGENKDSENEYRSLSKDRETVKLDDWKAEGEVPPEHRQKLDQFKADLRKKEYQLFSDIDDFREKLKDSLKNKIEALLKPDQSGPLLGLLWDLQDPIKICMREVELLATHKRVHDSLHEIRQFVIRKWREEVLPKWADGRLEGNAEKSFYKGRRNMAGPLRDIQRSCSQLGDSSPALTPRLCEIDEVSKKFDADELADELLGNRDDFEDEIDYFAEIVQVAFTTANNTMQERLSVLFEAYSRFERLMGDARGNYTLDKVQQIIAKQIEAVHDQLKELRDLLSKHNQWQTVHDQLERLDAGKNSDRFPRDIQRFVATSKNTLKPLLCKIDAFTAFEKNPGKLCKLAEIVLRKLEDLQTKKTADCYGALRNDFDDLFFEVDVATKTAVEQSEKIFQAFEGTLQELRKQGRPPASRD